MAKTLVAQGAPDIARFGPALRQALARGGKIKMTLGGATPKGKRLGEANVKPRLGLAGRVLFKANCQVGPINHPTAEGTQNQGT